MRTGENKRIKMDSDRKTADWLNQVLEEISELENNAGIKILKNCGKECCAISSLYESALKVRKQHSAKKDIDTIFNQFKDEYYNSERLSKSGNLITLIFEACTCPMVEAGVSNSYFCHCTTGYSEKIFETLFDRKVTVDLVQFANSLLELANKTTK
jgi:hypothetical protein